MIPTDQLTQKFIRRWRHCPDTMYSFKNTIPDKYLKNNLSTFLKTQIAKKEIPLNMDRLKNRIMPEMRSFTGEYLLQPELDTDVYCSALSEFIKEAKAFDPQLSNNDIYQAGRNVLTMYVIQDLLSLKIALTPSVLAYSLLYPYTDNYLDNPRISRRQKERFNNHLTQKLSGAGIHADDENEETIFTLIDMIEEQYSRSSYPQVYQSLHLIHRAQCASLHLFNNRSLTPSELLEICFNKGGTSVLTDGYLVAGCLTNRQQEYLYGLGIYLQLLDDLQDIGQDIAMNIYTYFAHYANVQPIDCFANRFLYFGDQVLEQPPDPTQGSFYSAVTSHKRITQLLFLNTAQKILPYFSRDYQTYLKPFLKN
jgi:hypothetical protein